MAMEVALQAHRRRVAFPGINLASPAPESAPFTVVVDAIGTTEAFKTLLGSQTHHHRNGQSLVLVRLGRRAPSATSCQVGPSLVRPQELRSGLGVTGSVL